MTRSSAESQRTHLEDFVAVGGSGWRGLWHLTEAMVALLKSLRKPRRCMLKCIRSVPADLPRADVWALREQLGQAQREHELAQDQIERLRLDVPVEVVAIAPTSSSTQAASKRSPVPLSGCPSQVTRKS